MSIARRSRIVSVVVVLVVAASVSVAQAGKIYWSNHIYPDRSLQRANLDGSNVEDVSSGYTQGIAIDSVDRKVYWGHFSSDLQNKRILRADLNGANQQVLYDLGEVEPISIALDRDHGKLYVSIGISGGACMGIMRFDMDGSGDIGDGEAIVEDTCVQGVAVDSGAGKLYWSEYPLDAIRRAELDGSSIETVVALDATPGMIDLDASRGKVYWTQALSTDLVLRADLDGSNVETLIVGDTSNSPGIALDLRSDMLYWLFDTLLYDEILRADLDGANPETILHVETFGQIALDPVPSGADVPAVSLRGVVVLLLLLLVVSAAAIRRRGVARRGASG